MSAEPDVEERGLVRVRGAASPEELAALLAALGGLAEPGASGAAAGGYERWRRDRIAALRRR